MSILMYSELKVDEKHHESRNIYGIQLSNNHPFRADILQVASEEGDVSMQESKWHERLFNAIHR